MAGGSARAWNRAGPLAVCSGVAPTVLRRAADGPVALIDHSTSCATFVLAASAVTTVFGYSWFGADPFGLPSPGKLLERLPRWARTRGLPTRPAARVLPVGGSMSRKLPVARMSA